MHTISSIAQHNEAIGHHYFSRDTLRSFGQTRRMFKVKTVDRRIFVYAPSYWDGWANPGETKLVGYSIAEYNPETGQLSGVSAIDKTEIETDWQASQAIYEYVKLYPRS